MKKISHSRIINHKKRIMFYSVFFMLFFISIGYAYMNTTLSISSHVAITGSKNLNLTLRYLSDSCKVKYDGEVTDRVGETVTSSNVYFAKCEEKRNVIFGGFCWQVIRTTETGGTKLIYNGEPVSGKCEGNRGDHKGIIGTDGESMDMTGTYLYGSSFTYDKVNNTFTLVDTSNGSWSPATYENLLGKYTCKNTSNTCTTLYSINAVDYTNNTNAYVSIYTIGNTNYAQIGTSPFNAVANSPAMVGYKYNKVYIGSLRNPGTNSYKYGNSFTYDNSSNLYTLSGTTQTFNNWSTSYNTINNTHYTCWNTTGVCSTLSYIIYSDSVRTNYYDLTDGKSIDDILNEMINNEEINKYNSLIKGYLENWFDNNLSQYELLLEDGVSCNSRNVINYGAFNFDGGSTFANPDYYLKFSNYSILNKSLACPRVLDQFSVSNLVAKLNKPISLVTMEEWNNIDDSTLAVTGVPYWTMSPDCAYAKDFVRYILNDGSPSSTNISDLSKSLGIRPSIILKRDIKYVSGSGSPSDPWIIN